MGGHHRVGRQAGALCDLADILPVRSVVAAGQRPERRRAGARGGLFGQRADAGDERLPIEHQRIVVEHQGAVGRHALAQTLGRFGAEGVVQGQDAIADVGIDGAAELHHQRRLAGIEQPRLVLGVAHGRNGASVTPAPSSRARTARAVATAWAESP